MTAWSVVVFLKPVSERGRERVNNFIQGYRSSPIYPSSARMLEDGTGEITFRHTVAMGLMGKEKAASFFYAVVATSSKEPIEGQIEIAVEVH